MNAQMVYEIWKKTVQNNIVGRVSVFPTEAEEYVLGDDSKFDMIPEHILWLWEYPKVLVEELGGEGAEMAKRCLRTFARLNKGGLFSGRDPKLLKRLGFTLKDILNDGLTNIGNVLAGENYMNISRDIYEAMTDDAEKFITPEYLKSIIVRPQETSHTMHMAFYIAGYMILDGKGNIKGLSEEILNYSHKVGGSKAAILFRMIYKLDKRFEDRLRELMKHSSNIMNLWRVNAKGLEALAEELGVLDYYMYAGVTKKLGSEECAEYSARAAESYDKLLPWMMSVAAAKVNGGNKSEENDNPIARIMKLFAGNKAAADEVVKRNTEKRIDELCMLAYPLGLALKDGNGKELLDLYEQYFTEMLVYISEYFSVSVEKESAANNFKSGRVLAHEINKDCEKAAEMLRFEDKSFARYDANTVIKAFSALYDYSQKAADIIYTFIKSAEYHGNVANYSSAAVIISIFCSARNELLGCSAKDSLKLLFERGISLNTYFLCGTLSNDFYQSECKFAYNMMSEVIKENMPEAIAFYSKIKDDAKSAAYWADMLYKKSGCKDIDTLMLMMKSKSKNVRKVASDIISAGEDDFREHLESTLPKLKGDALVQAEAIIKKWDNNKKYGKDFTFSTNELAEEYVAENPNPAAVKKAAFIPEEYFADVRYADLNGTASKELVRYIISEYFCLSEPYRISVCDKLAAKLYAPDLHTCIENIYQDWLEKGADNKTKMIMVPYCIYASDTQILALKKQIASWAEAQRGALGAFVINAVAINGGSTALMMVNDISAKFPHNQVKKAAKAAFTYAAKALDLPEDVLADKIVPTLGLDKNGEAVIDYGARTFTLSLMPDFSISFFDNEKQKSVKSLPKPAAADDAVKAEEAKKYVSELKKQLKAVTAAQKTRLETVFRNGRTWDTEAWSRLFVDNPVMHRFACTLVWGVYNDGKLGATFRYSDDGSFCDENDDIFELPENAVISLVHPIELEQDIIDAWLEQLSDYEIVQPFAQISANVITLGTEDVDEKNYISKYNGRTFTVSSMNNAAKKHNFIRSTVEDGGGFTGYHIQDRVLGIGIKFGFEGMYMGQDYAETVELTNVYIYNLPEEDEQPGSYSEYDAVSPMEISNRFISCCLNTLETILD